MRYVGHADMTASLRYTHLVPEYLRGVVGAAEYGTDGHELPKKGKLINNQGAKMWYRPVATRP